MSVWVEDVFWFIFRIINPLTESCLAGRWIQAAVRCESLVTIVQPDRLIVPRPDWIIVNGPEWTARWGYVPLGTDAIPYWYIVTLALLGIAYYYVFYRRGKPLQPGGGIQTR